MINKQEPDLNVQNYRYSKDPSGRIYTYTTDEAAERHRIERFFKEARGKCTVAVQGLGFVGTAMVAALVRTVTNNEPVFNVIGIDLPDERNYWKIARVNEGLPPVISTDTMIEEAYARSAELLNLYATYSVSAYSRADIVVVDIQLDVEKGNIDVKHGYSVCMDTYRESLAEVACSINKNTLVIIETTLPPGTIENVVYPLFVEIFCGRGWCEEDIRLAYSYERVMPGKNYLASVTDYFRVFAGVNKESASMARRFFEQFMNTTDYPLSELHSATAAEMAKVLENSYRAMNIAFIQEWTEFAQAADVNIFQVLDAIRVRSTHKNIMNPGFGVGGYCLPKDSLLADWAFREFFGSGRHLDMSIDATYTNDHMPLYSFSLLKSYTGDLSKRRVTLLGVSYLSDIADTRYSPSQLFYEACMSSSADIIVHDSIVEYWKEKDIKIETDIKSMKTRRHDILVFAVRHQEYLSLSAEEIIDLFPGVCFVLDANNVIADSVGLALMVKGVQVVGVGKGHWNKRS